MAEGDIWISNVLNETEWVAATDIDRCEPAWQAIERGENPSEADLPIRIYAKYKDQKFDTGFPEWASGGGGIKISPRLKDIFTQFNLGSTCILDAQLYLYDRKTPVDVEFSIFGDWEKLNFLVIEECKGLRGRPKTRHRPNPPPPDTWGMSWDMKDGDIVIAPGQLGDLDFWRDAKLRHGLFFSDGLKNALAAGGYSRIFKFVKCRVLPVH